jgi:lipopolysaccharide/colanic/teichoic acid biosynthesis glycosyltransferase
MSVDTAISSAASPVYPSALGLPYEPVGVAGGTAAQPRCAALPTIWGMDPVALHDHFWAVRGVFVVRPGVRTEIPDDAELYLLTDADTLALFRLAPLIEGLSWLNPSVCFVRLANTREQTYRESVEFDESGRFKAFRRAYSASSQSARLALTRSRRVAAVWQSSTDIRGAWRQLRREARVAGHEIATVRGRSYDRNSEPELAQLCYHLLQRWNHLSRTAGDVAQLKPGVWAHKSSTVAPSTRFVEQVWVGAGRRVEANTTVVGPAILWDVPEQRPEQRPVEWTELVPISSNASRKAAMVQPKTRRGPPGKRLFDIVFALVAILLTSPVYPLVMFAIWVEDGWPFFFLHRRQTLGGREFPCIKFRSMRKDADRIKRSLQAVNKADGPQFFMEQDPRLTKVGSIIRKLKIDELPQFFNVLLGDMSVVGPRPSPSSENQFNPSWREARLSVRAGVTGLWQVRATRRPGLDFQEWIKYDLEYVEKCSWRMDLHIIYRTLRLIFRGGTK